MIVATMGALALAGALGGFAFVYSGFYDIGAGEPHWQITLSGPGDRTPPFHQVSRGGDIVPPTNLGDQDRILAGAVHFATHCAICHSAPGAKAKDLAEGMYPKPPELTNASRTWSPGELFWIVKHGIKMSGMPSWADHGDDQLWNSVAFLESLPSMTPENYKKLLETANAKGIGHQMGGMQVDEAGSQAGAKAMPEMPGMDGTQAQDRLGSGTNGAKTAVRPK